MRKLLALELSEDWYQILANIILDNSENDDEISSELTNDIF